MKLLLENWREYLTEAAKTVEDLPDNVIIAVHTYGAERATIQYELQNSNDRVPSESSPIQGRIGIMTAPAPCGNVLEATMEATVEATVEMTHLAVVKKKR